MGINGCQDEFSPPSECFTTNYVAVMGERKESCGPILKTLIERKTLKNDEDLYNWANGKGANAWVPAATILLPEGLVAQYCMKCFCSFHSLDFLKGPPLNSQINHTWSLIITHECPVSAWLVVRASFSHLKLSRPHFPSFLVLYTFLLSF